ncbi:hypothetical protein ACFW08_05855 [Streptomyces sp. NPDC058960]|uniref:hypothetical protein n=1 Tax=Streptomyces sp. NPDC058960 TaxID=3346679 RepID=UPI0036A78EFB
MPKNDSWSQGVSYPVLGDAPDIEAAMSALVNGLVPLTVMRFANANARAATLSGPTKPVPGMVTYLIAEDRWEGYQADGSWLLLSDGPWQPLTYATGFRAHSGSPGWRKKAGGGIELRGTLETTTGKLNDGGNALKFASIPSAVAPGASRFFITAMSQSIISGITRMSARIQVSTNGDLLYVVDAGGGQGSTTSPAWFALDGIQFSPAGD